MSQTILPGSKGMHAIISDICRDLHGDEKAFEIAVVQMKKIYDRICKNFGKESGVKLHIAITVERAEPQKVVTPSTLTTDQNDPDLNKIKEDGQQEKYIVLSDEEKAKGFVRPVRLSYIHKTCGGLTKMNISIAETYARDPSFYGGTFCVACGTHFDLVKDNERQFHWEDGSGVGE